MKNILASTRKNWILIIDNADNPREDYSSYFPPGGPGDIILTTRDSTIAGYYASDSTCTQILEELPPEPAAELLLCASGIAKGLWPVKRNVAASIVDELDRHTLALLIAGGQIQQSFATLEGYVLFHKKNKGQLLSFNLSREAPFYRTLLETFETSANYLEQMSQDHQRTQQATDASDLLHILPFLHRQSCKKSMFAKAGEFLSALPDASEPETMRWPYLTKRHRKFLAKYAPFKGSQKGNANEDSQRWTRASKLLAGLQIVTLDNEQDPQILTMHPLVHLWAFERQDHTTKQKSWHEVLVILSMSCFRDEDDRSELPALEVHIQAFFEREVPAFSRMLPIAIRAPLMQKLYEIQLSLPLEIQTIERGIERLIQSVDYSLKRAQTEKPWLVDFERLRGLYEYGQGKPNTATYTLQSVVRKQKERLSETHPDLVRSEHALLQLRMNKENARRAISEIEEHIKLEATKLQKDDPWLLQLQYDLAKRYMNVNRSAKAIKILKDVVNIGREKWQGQNFRRLLGEMELAEAYATRSGRLRFEKAINILQGLIALEQRTFSEEDPGVLELKVRLSQLYEKNEDLANAIDLMEEVQVVRARTLLWDNENSITSKHTLGRLLVQNESWSEALPILEDVLGIERELEDHYSIRHLKSKLLLTKAYGQLEMYQ